MKETISIKFSNNQFIYKILIILLLIFTPMMILFLFGGEINLNQQNWLVATWGKEWGLLKDNTYGFGINVDAPIVSWEPFVYSIVIIFSTTIIFFILYKFKKIDLLFYTLIFSSWFVLFNILITGLLYPSPNDDEIWKIFVRIIIIIFSFIIIFFPLNAILNSVMARSRHAEDYTQKIINNEISANNYIKNHIDIVKIKKKKKISSIDIKE